MTEAEKIAKGLTEAQRERLLSFRAEPSQMGIGMMSFLPDMVKPADFNHPVFGPHYSLNELGLEVRRILENPNAK